MRSSSRIVFALLALAAFSGTTWATCVGAAAIESQQMACCAAGHDQCPMHKGASACCTTPAAQPQTQATLVKATALTAPLFQSALLVVYPATVASSPRRQFATCYSPPVDAVHAPPYIAFAALLI